jgi:hypothetical protein
VAETSISDSAPGGDEGRRPAVALLPFHRDILEYLRTEEAELWAWFSSTSFLDEYAAATRLDLLKSCYRFDPADHADLYGLVGEVAGRLGLTAPITLYQSQQGAGMNASLCYMPREAHLLFEGAIRATLGTDELRAIVAHELTHYLLWEREGGELLVADQMLHAMAGHARAEPSHVETARLFRLYLEVQCDRAALAVSPDPLVAIAALIKVQTGLADAQAESYLRQSDEIFGQTEVKTEQLTHPESYIRARALKLWADQGEAANAEIARMIEGPADLGRLSLLGQRRFGGVTRAVLRRFLGAEWLRTEPILAHARLFFPDLDPEAGDVADSADLRTLEGALAGAGESMRKYVGYVLLDLATVDRSLEQAPLAAAVRLSDELGIGETFLALAAQELGVSKRVLTRLKKDAAKAASEGADGEPPEA